MASRIVWPAECRVSEYLAVGLPIEDIRRGTGSGCGRIEVMLVGERVKAKKKAVERAGKKLEMSVGIQCLAIYPIDISNPLRQCWRLRVRC